MEAEGLYMRTMKPFKISFLVILFIIVVRRQPLAAESQGRYSPENILRAHGVALTQRAVVAALRKNKNILVRRSAADRLAPRAPKPAPPILQPPLPIEHE